VSGLFAVTSLPVCIPWFCNTSSCSHAGLDARVCVYHFAFRCPVLCTLGNINVHKLYRVSLNTHSSQKWGIQRLGGR
jgi:hypothetical protein